MKKIISIIPIISIIAIISFAPPSQTYAAWWNPLSWFSQSKQVEEQQPQSAASSNAALKPQTVSENVEAAERQKLVTPLNNTQPSDAKTIEALKAEVATLKSSLDNLYKAHNELLKYTTEIVAVIRGEIKNTPQTPIGSTLETKVTSLNTRVTELERKTGLLQEDVFNTSNELARQTMLSGLSGVGASDLKQTIEIVCRGAFGGVVCPPFSPSPSLKDRIEKLERGY